MTNKAYRRAMMRDIRAIYRRQLSLPEAATIARLIFRGGKGIRIAEILTRKGFEAAFDSDYFCPDCNGGGVVWAHPDVPGWAFLDDCMGFSRPCEYKRSLPVWER